MYFVEPYCGDGANSCDDCWRVGGDSVACKRKLVNYTGKWCNSFEASANSIYYHLKNCGMKMNCSTLHVN